MPGKPGKTHRMRVRVIDGKTREWNKLRGQLGAHLDVVDAQGGVEFIVCGVNAAQLEGARAKLGGAGIEEIPGGNTIIPRTPTGPASPRGPSHVGGERMGGGAHRDDHGGGRGAHPKGGRPSVTPKTDNANLKKKPYAFVPLPGSFKTKAPVWHDGTSSQGRLSGEVRFEIEALTPLLVGWERQRLDDQEALWFVPATQVPVDVSSAGDCAANKSMLCPLRAPWGANPVIIPGDSLKGLLRHELGALLGAPMERVAERSYSYRPNAMFAKGATLVPRIARVPEGGVEMKVLDGPLQVRVPTILELLPNDLEYDKNRKLANHFYRFDDGNGAAYRGGQGAGDMLNSKRNLHTTLLAKPSTSDRTKVPQFVQQGYLATLRHLVDGKYGHFTERHPHIPKEIRGEAARARILEAAQSVVFQPGDLIWVEWDTQKNCIVSLGWHYYYRWAYTDSVRQTGGTLERYGLFPLVDERARDDMGAPKGLSHVRRLFGYTGDNDGSSGIGEGDHSQLMGRLFPNAAVEVVGDNDADDERFLKPTFLKELGMPRPSAVENYLKQPHHPEERPSDRAKLVTYGDARGYDTPGELAGRKFYLDRSDAYGTNGALVPGPAADPSDENRLENDRSTLGLKASRPGRRFRFTLRFRDLDPAELAAVFIALCPDQFKAVLGGDHPEGYCSKLGYARPLGWGSVQIQAKALLWLDTDGAKLTSEVDVVTWVQEHHTETSTQKEWLDIHRRKHPDAGDYPRMNGAIFTHHTTLRAEHSRARRYAKEK